MLETLDTQMLDYQNDADFTMHLAPSDQWFHEEAFMEDDGRQDPGTTIEVDMESYDESLNPEYEMEDGSENLELQLDAQENQDVDVEVYDASRAHSPDAVLGHHAVALSVDTSVDHVPILAEFNRTDLLGHTPPVHPESESFDSLPPEVRDSHTSSPELQNPALSVDNNDQLIRAEKVESLPPVQPSESKQVLPESAGHTLEEYESRDHAELQRSSADKLATSEQADGLQDTSLTDFGGDVDESIIHNRDNQTEPTEHDHQPVIACDPHEISEGVYIDPPPAVLISLSSGTPSISLFNAPSQSGSNSQSTDHFDVSHISVLLSHMPTLYYEPLSSVFEALRQEDYLLEMDILNGELLLDAYELELVMSEDYTFAHEVSLHDLNILHDGLNKSGPLRLRLKTSTPRFMDRYHTLQEQIARFHLTEAKDTADLGSEELEPEGGMIIPYIIDESHSPITIGYSQSELEEHGEEHYDSESTQELQQPENDNDQAETRDSVLPEITDLQEQHDADHDCHDGAEDISEYTNNSKEGNHEESIVVGGAHVGEDSSTDSESRSVAGAECDAQPYEDGEVDYSEGISEEARYLETKDIHHVSVVVPEGRIPSEVASGPVIEKALAIGTTCIEDAQQSESPRHLNLPDLPDDKDKSEDLESLSTNLDDMPVAGFGLTADVDGEPDQAGGLIFTLPILDFVLTKYSTGSSVDPTRLLPTPDEFGSTYEIEDSWDDTLDGEGELDWEVGEQEHDTDSNLSSVTLSSKNSTKRSLSEAELEEFEDDGTPASSP
ncbi:hypothetical protein H0H81_001529, partial [Sphagnurus paluster]